MIAINWEWTTSHLFNTGPENHSPGVWQRRLATVGGSLRASQRRIRGGNRWFKAVVGGDCTFTPRLSYLCSRPELNHGCPELLDKRHFGSESLIKQLVQVSLAVTGGARIMVPTFLKSWSSALLLSPVLGTEYAKEWKKYQIHSNNYHFP